LSHHLLDSRRNAFGRKVLELAGRANVSEGVDLILLEEGAMIGLDTGFFVELLRGRGQAVAFCERLTEGYQEALVSCLTLFEIERLGLRGAISGVEVPLEGIQAVCRVSWIRSQELLCQAARMRHGIQEEKDGKSNSRQKAHSGPGRSYRTGG
jgi:hypothetical protein